MANVFDDIRLPDFGDLSPEDQEQASIGMTLYVLEDALRSLSAVCQDPDGRNKLITSSVQLVNIYSQINNIIQFIKP